MLKPKDTLAMVLTWTILSLLPGHLHGQEPTATEIMTREDNRADGDDRKSAMTMTLINAQGRQRVRKVETLSKDFGEDKKSVMVFKDPADVKGTVFLSWEYDDPAKEDDKWLYMPALKKERRISGASKKEYFMGTDFTYDDMGDRKVFEDSHTLLGRETVLGHDCWKIESIPVDPEDMYVRKIVWVSQQADLIIQAEYYDKDGLLKVYKALDVRNPDGFWATYRSEMDNVSQKHKTLFDIEFMQYNTGIDDDVFRVANIQRGHIRQ